MNPPLSLLGPEARLLLGALRAGLDSDETSGRRERLVPAAGTERLDWERLYRLLGRELAPSALHPVTDRLHIEPPAEWEERLRALGAVSGFHQKHLLSTLEEALGILADCGVSVCLVKGAALALAAYPDPLQRPMADLDLLVEDGELEAAWKALTDAGWRWDDELHPGELYELRQHAPPLRAPGREGRVVELHDALFIEGHPFRFGPEALRTGARVVRVGGVEAAVPAPATHLVYTCLHFAWSHTLAKRGWRTFRDVTVLSEAPDFSWREFGGLAEASGAGKPCYWTLRLARELGGVGVPDEVLERLRPPGLPRAALRVLVRHFTLRLFAEEGACPSVWLGRAAWRVAVRPRGEGGGGVLPWAYDAGFRDDGGEGGGKRPGMVRRLARHAARADRWAKYLGAVLGGRP